MCRPPTPMRRSNRRPATRKRCVRQGVRRRYACFARRTAPSACVRLAHDNTAHLEQLEDGTTVETLKKLKRQFLEADEDGNGTLELDEFIVAFRGSLGRNSSSDDELTALFLKIDVSNDGRIDWVRTTERAPHACPQPSTTLQADTHPAVATAPPG